MLGFISSVPSLAIGCEERHWSDLFLCHMGRKTLTSESLVQLCTLGAPSPIPVSTCWCHIIWNVPSVVMLSWKQHRSNSTSGEIILTRVRIVMGWGFFRFCVCDTKVGHFVDVLLYQSFGLILTKLSKKGQKRAKKGTWQKQTCTNKLKDTRKQNRHKNSCSLPSFKRKLKTFLFRHAFSYS